MKIHYINIKTLDPLRTPNKKFAIVVNLRGDENGSTSFEPFRDRGYQYYAKNVFYGRHPSAVKSFETEIECENETNVLCETGI